MSRKEIAVSLAWLHHEVSIDLKRMKKIQRKMGQITKNKKEILKKGIAAKPLNCQELPYKNCSLHMFVLRRI